MKLQDAGLFRKKQPARERMSARPKRMTGLARGYRWTRMALSFYIPSIFS